MPTALIGDQAGSRFRASGCSGSDSVRPVLIVTLLMFAFFGVGGCASRPSCPYGAPTGSTLGLQIKDYEYIESQGVEVLGASIARARHVSGRPTNTLVIGVNPIENHTGVPLGLRGGEGIAAGIARRAGSAIDDREVRLLRLNDSGFWVRPDAIETADPDNPDRLVPDVLFSASITASERSDSASKCTERTYRVVWYILKYQDGQRTLAQESPPIRKIVVGSLMD